MLFKDLWCVDFRFSYSVCNIFAESWLNRIQNAWVVIFTFREMAYVFDFRNGRFGCICSGSWDWFGLSFKLQQSFFLLSFPVELGWRWYLFVYGDERCVATFTSYRLEMVVQHACIFIHQSWIWNNWQSVSSQIEIILSQ